MKKSTVLWLCFFASLASLAGVPVKWTVETSRADTQEIDLFHGETLDLEVQFKTYGQILPLPTNEIAMTYWQTNGMGTAYWRTNNVTIVSSNGIMRSNFLASMDVGTKTLRGFMGIAGNIYRASFVLHFKDAPGYEPSIVEWPYRELDFAKVTVTNDLWYRKGESDQKELVQDLRFGNLVTNAVTSSNLVNSGAVAVALRLSSQYTDNHALKVLNRKVIQAIHMEQNCPIVLDGWGTSVLRVFPNGAGLGHFNNPDAVQFFGSGGVSDLVADGSDVLTETKGNTKYLGIGSKAVDADKLDGHDSSYFVTASGANYLPATKDYLSNYEVPGYNITFNTDINKHIRFKNGIMLSTTENLGIQRDDQESIGEYRRIKFVGGRSDIGILESYLTIDGSDVVTQNSGDQIFIQKVKNPRNGYLASIDALGNVGDSGKRVSDLQTNIIVSATTSGKVLKNNGQMIFWGEESGGGGGGVTPLIVTNIVTNVVSQAYIRQKLGVYLYVGPDNGIYVHVE